MPIDPRTGLLTSSGVMPSATTASMAPSVPTLPWYELASSFGAPGAGLSPLGETLRAQYTAPVLGSPNAPMATAGRDAALTSGGYGTPIFGRDATDWVSQPYTSGAQGEGGTATTTPMWYSKSLNAITPYDPATGMDSSGQYQRYTPQWYDQQNGPGSYASAVQQYAPQIGTQDPAKFFANLWQSGDAMASQQAQPAENRANMLPMLAASIIGGGALAGALGGVGAAGAGGAEGAGALGSLGGDAGMFGGLADLEAAYPGLYGQAAGDAAAGMGAGGGFSYSGQGLGSALQAAGGGGDGLTQLASDAGDEIAWGGANENFQPTMYDTATGEAPGGLAGFLGGISPNTWATLGGQLLNTGAGLYAQNQAVNAQTGAANNAAALQAQMYAQNRADLAPWREAGVGALGSLTSQMPEFTRRFGMSDYTQDPGYQFRLSEGEKGINRAAQARGLFDSGGTMKALGAYNSNMASQEYGNAYNRFTQDQNNAYNKLSNLAGMGQTTAQQVANMGANYAGAAGDLGLQAANARASGYIGGANTVANAVNQGLTSYNQMSMLPYLRGYLGP